MLDSKQDGQGGFGFVLGLWGLTAFLIGILVSIFEGTFGFIGKSNG